jgi:hypothetical protein
MDHALLVLVCDDDEQSNIKNSFDMNFSTICFHSSNQFHPEKSFVQ